MAQCLSGIFKIAVQGISYYDVERKCHAGNEEKAYLYQQEYCKIYGLPKAAFLV